MTQHEERTASRAQVFREMVYEYRHQIMWALCGLGVFFGGILFWLLVCILIEEEIRNNLDLSKEVPLTLRVAAFCGFGSVILTVAFCLWGESDALETVNTMIWFGGSVVLGVVIVLAFLSVVMVILSIIVAFVVSAPWKVWVAIERRSGHQPSKIVEAIARSPNVVIHHTFGAIERSDGSPT